MSVMRNSKVITLQIMKATIAIIQKWYWRYVWVHARPNGQREISNILAAIPSSPFSNETQKAIERIKALESVSELRLLCMSQAYQIARDEWVYRKLCELVKRYATAKGEK